MATQDAITLFAGADMNGATQMAKALAQSTLIPKALQNKPGDVLVVLLTGREFGLGPMQAMRSIHVVEGKPTMAADLMVGLCLARREVCEFFLLVESSGERATYRTKRVGAPDAVSMTFTIEQARAAGVANKDNWRKYPDAMLRARCSSALARAVYPDLLAGTYDPDELAAEPARAPEPEPQPTQTLPRVDVVAKPSPQERAAKATDTLVYGEQGAPKAEAEKAKQHTSDPLGALVAFGPHKGSRIEALSDEELADTIAEGHARINGTPGARWVPSVREHIRALEGEVQRRLDVRAMESSEPPEEHSTTPAGWEVWVGEVDALTDSAHLAGYYAKMGTLDAGTVGRTEMTKALQRAEARLKGQP